MVEVIPSYVVSKALTLWIDARIDGMKKFHRADIIDVDFFFKYDDHSLAIKLDRQDRGREKQFADGRFSLMGAAVQRLAVVLTQVQRCFSDQNEFTMI